ncbi:MAG: phytanoyl-CoA dioxygenase family protein [Deltaproteobacteria bacterium]|nr:phytanoyl-CoA dioxygenase family protein [Myxococcales bacterium]MDP3214648.1 phytanoyl-CoA dioxygenase family protein [Deltaproteobacteria bacterium]
MTPAELRAQMDLCGMVVVRSALDGADVEVLRECMETLLRRGIPTSRQVLYTHAEPTTPRDDLWVLMEQWINPHRVPAAGSTFDRMRGMGAWLKEHWGGELIPFQDVLLAKHPSHRVFPWHQDEPYWPVDTSGGVIAWVALDRVEPSNGGVEFALCSHRDGLGPAIDLHTGEAQQGTTAPLPSLAGYEIVCPVLETGDAVLFHPRTWHRSGVNRHAQTRRAWASTWLPPDARWNRDRAPRHPLVGRFEHGALVAQPYTTEGTR